MNEQSAKGEGATGRLRIANFELRIEKAKGEEANGGEA
jgi:hypothetical protein